MMALKEFGPELSPKYETVMRKRDAKPFEWTYETFEDALRKGVNKEGKAIFADLGYSIGFFSSLNNDEAAGISIHTGISYPKFSNTFIVDLPLTFPIYENEGTAHKIIALFKKCVQVFDPFWGCISNSLNMNRYDKYLKDGMPITVHWVNYFGENIVKKISPRKLRKAPVLDAEELSNGYFIRLKELPIDDTDLKDIKIQAKANKYLGL